MDKHTILDYIKTHPGVSSKEITDAMAGEISLATVKRYIREFASNYYIYTEGKARATRYYISPLFAPVDINEYFSKEIDEREGMTGYNFNLISDTLSHIKLFTERESAELYALQERFSKNYSALSEDQKRKEMERLGIDLSWKSSQIEGNTYSLLETERLLKEKQTASGKTKEEAIMLLNHKDAHLEVTYL